MNTATPHTFTPPIMIDRKVNIWNIGALIVTGLVMMFGWGVTYATFRYQLTDATSQISRNETETSQRIGRIEKQIAKASEQMDNLTTLQFQVNRSVEMANENRLNIEETNKRIDRLLDQLGNRIEGMADNINRLATRIEVLNATMVLPASEKSSPQRRPGLK